MNDVANDQRGEEGEDDYFLQGQVDVEMPPSSGEHENVYEAKEGTNMGELDNGNKSRCWEFGWWGTTRWPGCLRVMCGQWIGPRSNEACSSDEWFIYSETKVIEIWDRRGRTHRRGPHVCRM